MPSSVCVPTFLNNGNLMFNMITSNKSPDFKNIGGFTFTVLELYPFPEGKIAEILGFH